VERISRIRQILARLGGERGFGIVELLVAMTVLSVGLFALLGTFTNGYRILTRASSKGAASVLADKTMESYRGMQYSDIPCAVTPPPTTCSTTTTNPVGPDGRTYAVTTIVTKATATNTDGTCTAGTACSRTVKVVDVAVSETVIDASGHPSLRQLARERSTFDPLTGQLSS